MNHLAFPLDPAVDRHHAGTEHDPARPLEQLWPDDNIGRAGFVLDGDEHRALRRARPLAHQHQAGGHQPSRVARRHRLGTGDDPAAGKVGPVWL